MSDPSGGSRQPPISPFRVTRKSTGGLGDGSTLNAGISSKKVAALGSGADEDDGDDNHRVVVRVNDHSGGRRAGCLELTVENLKPFSDRSALLGDSAVLYIMQHRIAWYAAAGVERVMLFGDTGLATRVDRGNRTARGGAYSLAWETDVMFCPVHADTHWSLMVLVGMYGLRQAAAKGVECIDRDTFCLYHFDSLPGSSHFELVGQILSGLFTGLDESEKSAVSALGMQETLHIAVKCELQTDATSCGWHMCRNMELCLSGAFPVDTSSLMNTLKYPRAYDGAGTITQFRDRVIRSHDLALQKCSSGGDGSMMKLDSVCGGSVPECSAKVFEDAVTRKARSQVALLGKRKGRSNSMYASGERAKKRNWIGRARRRGAPVLRGRMVAADVAVGADSAAAIGKSTAKAGPSGTEVVEARAVSKEAAGLTDEEVAEEVPVEKVVTMGTLKLPTSRTTVKLSSIRTRETCFRMPTKESVSLLAANIVKNGFSARHGMLTVTFEVDGKYLLTDGYHRLAALRYLLGTKDADVVPEEVDVLLVDDSSIAENERGMFALRMSREINLADHVHAKMSLVDELYSVRSLLRESPKFKGLSDEERRAANVDGKMRKRMGEEVSRFVLPHCQMSHVSRYVRANAMFEDSPKAYRKFLELFETHRETRKRWNVTCLSVNVLYVAEAELKVLIIEAIHMYLVGVKAALRAPADGIVATATATFYNEGVKVVASKWNIDAAIVLDQTFTRGSSMQETCARDQLRAMITKATLYDGSGTSKGRKQTPNPRNVASRFAKEINDFYEVFPPTHLPDVTYDSQDNPIPFGVRMLCPNSKIPNCVSRLHRMRYYLLPREVDDLASELVEQAGQFKAGPSEITSRISMADENTAQAACLFVQKAEEVARVGYAQMAVLDGVVVRPALDRLLSHFASYFGGEGSDPLPDDRWVAEAGPAGKDARREGRLCTPREWICDDLEVRNPSLFKDKALVDLAMAFVATYMGLVEDDAEDDERLPRAAPGASHTYSAVGLKLLLTTKDCAAQQGFMEFAEKEPPHDTVWVPEKDPSYIMMVGGAEAFEIVGFPYSHIFGKGPEVVRELVATRTMATRVKVEPWSVFVARSDFFHAGTMYRDPASSEAAYQYRVCGKAYLVRKGDVLQGEAVRPAWAKFCSEEVKFSE